MQITNIRAVQPPTPGSPPDWRTQLGQIVVEVQTDAGLCGIGVGGGGAAGIHIIETVLRDLLVGREAREVEQLHAEMLRHTLFYGQTGLVVMAISGVDLALWDLRGKAADCSVARLLNPQVDLSQPLATYSTVFDDKAAREALAAGNSGVKLHVERFGGQPDPAEIAALVSRTRDALGDDAPLMLDAFAAWNVESTLRIAEALAPYNVLWIEEPLLPNDFNGFAELAEKCPIAIAGGEHEYTARGFKHLVDRRLHKFLQPDVNWCGGMTTLVEIHRMAAEADLRVCPHRGSEPFALPAVAALHSDVFGGQPLAESPRTWFTCLQGAPQIKEGVVRPSDAPGFGVSVDPDLWKD